MVTRFSGRQEAVRQADSRCGRVLSHPTLSEGPSWEGHREDQGKGTVKRGWSCWRPHGLPLVGAGAAGELAAVRHSSGHPGRQSNSRDGSGPAQARSIGSSGQNAELALWPAGRCGSGSLGEVHPGEGRSPRPRRQPVRRRGAWGKGGPSRQLARASGTLRASLAWRGESSPGSPVDEASGAAGSICHWLCPARLATCGPNVFGLIGPAYCAQSLSNYRGPWGSGSGPMRHVQEVEYFEHLLGAEELIRLFSAALESV